MRYIAPDSVQMKKAAREKGKPSSSPSPAESSVKSTASERLPHSSLSPVAWRSACARLGARDAGVSGGAAASKVEPQ